MLLYLKGALNRRLEVGEFLDEATLLDAIREGAVLRVRPKAMTVAVVLAGLVPTMVGHGAGSEVMQRIAAPMVGGMVTAPPQPGSCCSAVALHEARTPGFLM
jgi:Cu(I)/Ag(I) efflux system membrane protein CusA/SilA